MTNKGVGEMAAQIVNTLVILYERSVNTEQFVRICKALYGLYKQVRQAPIEIIFSFILAISTLFMSYSKSNKDFIELARRRINVLEDPIVKSFGYYVRTVRRSGLQISRKELTKLANLENPDTLFYLENFLLEPKELTEEIRRKLELALGLEYEEFILLQQTINS